MSTSGFHTWTREEVESFEACHQAGSEARLALYLMMCTGAAKSDLVKLGWGNVKAIKFTLIVKKQMSQKHRVYRIS